MCKMYEKYKKRDVRTTLESIFEQNDFEISVYQERDLSLYYQILSDWNTRVNLTSIIGYSEVLWKHYVDSCLILKCPEFQTEYKKILDVGTGAGFPGIILSIMCPWHEFVLIDSLKKRILYLEDVVSKLNLRNVKVCHGRAEDFGKKKEYRGKFDFVLSRAVAELPTLLEYCIPFVKEDSYFVAYKGKKYQEELDKSENALTLLSAEVTNIHEFHLEKEEEKRYLLFIKKMAETDSHYPRRAGKIKKYPL